MKGMFWGISLKKDLSQFFGFVLLFRASLDESVTNKSALKPYVMNFNDVANFNSERFEYIGFQY